MSYRPIFQVQDSKENIFLALLEITNILTKKLKKSRC